MSEIKLFRYGNTVEELKSSNVLLEKEIQKVIEDNMFEFFGVHFLQSEWSVDNDKRRMDSIGIDENNCPVIFEYKRNVNENVINQGLYYLNWLVNHKKDFQWLVLDKKDKKTAENIDWSSPRVICIAGDSNKYDEEAINFIDSNISLIRYTKFSNDLLMFELINTKTVENIVGDTDKGKSTSKYNLVTFKEQYEKAPEALKNMFEDIKDYIMSLGDDVSMVVLKLYTAFKKIKNFATIEIYPTKILVNFKLNPDNYQLDDSLRDIREIGHWGCGDMQISLKIGDDLTKTKELLKQSYELN